MINELFKYGSQYYVAGRYGVYAGFMPVAGNLHHHAIEMFLKGALASSVSSEELRFKLGHNLRRIWKRLKKEEADPGLSKFDKVIATLSKFEDIRYPDKLLRLGASLFYDITKAGASQSFVSGGGAPVPEYRVCLEEIDELVAAIFSLAGRNQKTFLNFMKPEAQQFLLQDNQSFKP